MLRSNVFPPIIQKEYREYYFSFKMMGILVVCLISKFEFINMAQVLT